MGQSTTGNVQIGLKNPGKRKIQARQRTFRFGLKRRANVMRFHGLLIDRPFLNSALLFERRLSVFAKG
jgi:hypothetical protein